MRILRGLWTCVRKAVLVFGRSMVVTCPDGSVVCFDLIGRHYRALATDECGSEDTLVRQLEDAWLSPECEAHLVVCISTKPDAEVTSGTDPVGVDVSALDLPSLRQCPTLRTLLDVPDDSPCVPRREIRVTTTDAAIRSHRGHRCYHFPVSVTPDEAKRVATTLEKGRA